MLVKVWLILLVQAASISCYCYRKNKMPSEGNYGGGQPGDDTFSIFVCVQSQNMSMDLKKAPSNEIDQVIFSMSSIAKVENNAFERLSMRLWRLEISYSDVEAMEDDAFKGLGELRELSMPGNRLTILKTAWFIDTPKIEVINFMCNRIKVIQPNLLMQMPNLEYLDIIGNGLVSLPINFMKQLPSGLRKFEIDANPLHYKQILAVAKWKKKKGYDMTSPFFNRPKQVFKLTEECLNDPEMMDKSDEAIDECVEEKMSSELFKISSLDHN